MTTYYVRKTGLDSNDGQSPGAAFLTIDKAANTVAAADTVYVGAGVYRELVTMDTAGSSGSPIQFIADLDGSQTGDAGLVIVSAHDSDTGSAQRAACWTFANALDPIYITVRGFTMQGGTTATINHSTASGNNSYEGLIIEDCAILGGSDSGDDGIALNYNEGAVPTGDGLRIRRCWISAPYGIGIELDWDENATAERDIDALIENCYMEGGGINRGIYWDRGSVGAYDLVGLEVHNCTFQCYYGVYTDDGASTTTPIGVYNSVFCGAQTGLYGATTSGMIESDYNTFFGCQSAYTNVTQGAHDRTNTDNTEVPPVLLGGIADFPLRAKLGWSPWLPWEPIYLTDGAMSQSVIGDADSTYAPGDDLYGNDRPMGADGFARLTYYFDGNDAITDNNTVWTNDSNAFNNNTANGATSSTTGSTNWLRGEGTTAPATAPANTGDIVACWFRMYHGTNNDGTQHNIHTDGQGESIGSLYSAVPNAWSAWTALTEPSGGWSWSKLDLLEWTFYLNAGSNTDVRACQLAVDVEVSGSYDDRGAVEARARPEQETTTVRTGSNAIRFEGAGYHDFLVPVAAQSTTITIYGRYDGTYAGTLPSMTVTNDDIMTEVTDTMTAAANTWEQLTSGAFTPSAAGIVRVRVKSSDTSADGECFFDDLEVT